MPRSKDGGGWWCGTQLRDTGQYLKSARGDQSKKSALEITSIACAHRAGAQFQFSSCDTFCGVRVVEECERIQEVLKNIIQIYRKSSDRDR